MLMLDEKRAMEKLPMLLKGHEDEGRKLLEYVRQVVNAGGPLNDAAKKRLAEVEKLFDSSTPAKEKSPK